MSLFRSKTEIRNSYRLCIFTITLLLAGCSAIKQQAAETKARGTFESGGYTWEIPADTAGGNTIRTHGLPSKQIATTASDTLCNKYDRVAQYVDNKGTSLLLGFVVFHFNCVR
jgi:uncharacterized protein YceK